MSFGFIPLNAITTADGYPNLPGNYVPYMLCAGAIAVQIDVANAPIYYQIAHFEPSGAIVWNPERFLLPGFRSLNRRLDAIQCRSAIPGQPALVTIEPLTSADLRGPN